MVLIKVKTKYNIYSKGQTTRGNLSVVWAMSLKLISFE